MIGTIKKANTEFDQLDMGHVTLQACFSLATQRLS